METDLNSDIKGVLAALVAGGDPTWSRFEPDDVTERLRLSQKVKAAADAFAVEMIAHADRTARAARAGSRTSEQLIASQGIFSAKDVRSDRWWARWVKDFDTFRIAWRSGEFTKSHLRVLRAVDNARTHHLMVREQQFFVDLAHDCGFDKFERAVAYWALANDPDGAEPREQLIRKGVSLRTRGDGSVTGTIDLDPLAGAVVKGVFDRELNKLAMRDADTDVERTSWKRGADALVNICSKAALRSDGTLPVPLINIVLGEKTAEDLLERAINNDPADSVQPFPIDYHDPDHRCELIDGTPIHPHFVEAAMAVGIFQRTILSADNRVLSTSQQRFFPQWMKHLLLLQSRGRCEIPGCDALFSWLQGDHIKPHSKGGTTDLGNGRMPASLQPSAADNGAKGNTWNPDDE